MPFLLAALVGEWAWAVVGEWAWAAAEAAATHLRLAFHYLCCLTQLGHDVGLQINIKATEISKMKEIYVRNET